MNNRTVWTAVVLVWTIPSVGVASAAESPSVVTMGAAELDRRSGQPVDISPWAYAWRADRAIQTPPEACFIPRRLDRIDKVLGTPEVSADRRVSSLLPKCKVLGNRTVHQPGTNTAISCLK